jgi:hypothetical protein
LIHIDIARPYLVHKDRSMPNFGFHIRHGDHSSDHNVDLPDVRAAHKEATMIFGDMARDVAAQLNETKHQSGEWMYRMNLGNLFSGFGCLRDLSNKLVLAA